MGMVVCNLAALSVGGAGVYPCEGFNPTLSLKAIEKYRCESACGVPSMFVSILKEFKDK